jgi:hypothetical protein
MPLLNAETSHVRRRATTARYRRIVTGATLALLPVLTTACHTWKTQPLILGQAERWSSPIRVELASGELLTLDAARVERDTLYGTARAKRGVQAGTPFALSMRDVRAIDERVFSGDRTAGVVVGSVLGAALIAVGAILLALSTWNNSE